PSRSRVESRDAARARRPGHSCRRRLRESVGGFDRGLSRFSLHPAIRRAVVDVCHADDLPAAGAAWLTLLLPAAAESRLPAAPQLPPGDPGRRLRLVRAGRLVLRDASRPGRGPELLLARRALVRGHHLTTGGGSALPGLTA